MNIETDNGAGNQYTTEFRQLDARFGRWFSPDPVFFAHQSPYNSMDGNPINLNDPNGDNPCPTCPPTLNLTGGDYDLFDLISDGLDAVGGFVVDLLVSAEDATVSTQGPKGVDGVTVSVNTESEDKGNPDGAIANDPSKNIEIDDDYVVAAEGVADARGVKTDAGSFATKPGRSGPNTIQLKKNLPKAKSPSTLKNKQVEAKLPASTQRKELPAATPKNTDGEVLKKQNAVDKKSKDYNEKFSNVTERAEAKGFPGVGTTPNGGPEFAGTDYLHPIDGTAVVKGQTVNGPVSQYVVIKLTGSRRKDFERANSIVGLPGTPDDYTWHHIDDFDASTGWSTLELVRTSAHKATVPHSGSVAQYEEFNGVPYRN